MEISLSVKPFVSYATSNCHYQPRNIVSMSCKATKIKHENFYKLLSLSSKSAKIDEIKRAYRKMVLKYHPDVCHTSEKEGSANIFVKLNEAYKVLSDPVSREEYDYLLSLGDSVPTYRSNTADDQLARKTWEGQLHVLKRQDSYRATQKDGSWGKRMRARSGKF